MVISHLLLLNVDGLCNEECGCGLDDFAPCGDGPYPDCEAAIKLIVNEDGYCIDPQDNKTVHCSEAQPGDSIFVPLLNARKKQ